MKYYVIHYPKRPERKESLLKQFAERNISLGDVTWVEGFNKDDHFTKWVKFKTKSPMPLGQMASAVKQYWIMRDIVDNDIPEAIIFEDDVVIDPEFVKLTPLRGLHTGLLRLGAGVHAIEPQWPHKPSANILHTITNPGGCEAFWVTKEFAEEYANEANFDYSIDMAQHGFLKSRNLPLLMIYVCHQTSIGEGGDSTTGPCPGDWMEYVRNFGTLTTYKFQDLVEEYRNSMTVMYPRKGHGLANTLIYLTDYYHKNPLSTSVVNDSIAEYELGKWLDFKFPTTSMTGIKTVYDPKIFINTETIEKVHPMVRLLIAPSRDMIDLIEKHRHLINGVTTGMHIRRGASAKDSRVIVEVDTDTFANDAAVGRFKAVAENFGPVFLASDSPETKKQFYNARTLDTTIAVVHGSCPDAPTKDRRNVFLDFFLLSMCPRLLITAGNFPGVPGLSTFGYMAAQYGGIKWETVPN
jgi:hypothetical protein